MKQINKNSTQDITFPLALGAILAVSAGLMDAYSFLHRGGVWANAQTGNLIMLGVSLATSRFAGALQYAVPALAFGIGVAFAYVLLHAVSPQQTRKGISMVLLLEIVGLAVSSLITENLYANALISLVCGMQLEAFPVISGYPMATTMCIGNYRTAVHSLAEAVRKKDRQKLKMAATYLLIIVLFVGGAILGNYLIELLGRWAILCSSVLLAFGLALFQIPWAEKKQAICEDCVPN